MPCVYVDSLHRFYLNFLLITLCKRSVLILDKDMDIDVLYIVNRFFTGFSTYYSCFKTLIRKVIDFCVSLLSFNSFFTFSQA